MRPSAADLVLDTSAVMAVLRDEPVADLVVDALRRSTGPIISSATVTELSVVAAARATSARAGADAARRLLDDAGVVDIPVDEAQSAAATDAWIRFGKGRHPAGLNLGDLFAYALAATWSLPLLCVGNDFPDTDIEVVELT